MTTCHRRLALLGSPSACAPDRSFRNWPALRYGPGHLTSVIDVDTATFGWAWVAATAALAVHVADEASHDFLAWYNPRATRIRTALRGLPFPPTFTFLPWLVGLLVAVGLLGVLTPVAFAGTRWLRPIAYFLTIIHLVNGLLHIVGSVVERRLVPGVFSAPLLLATGVWLGYATAQLT